MSRPSVIPNGSWPRRLTVELAAGYVGERSVDEFLARVKAGEYPAPCVDEGRRKLWLRDTLDLAIGADQYHAADAAADM